jgi:hypothetical protein
MSNETNDPKKRPGAIRVENDELPEAYPLNPPMATKAAEPKKWWESTGFFTSSILFFSGAWGLYSAEFEGSIKSAVMLVYTLVGTGAALRMYLVKAKLNVKAWLGDARTYEYLVAALAGIIPNLPADADDKLFDLVRAVKTGNIGIIISAAVTFAVFVWNVWKSQPPKKAAADQ